MDGREGTGLAEKKTPRRWNHGHGEKEVYEKVFQASVLESSGLEEACLPVFCEGRRAGPPEGIRGPVSGA